MKKLIAVALMLCFLIPCALADDDWYYPFGFSSDTTYDMAIARLLSMYETEEDRIVREETTTTFFPVGYTMFDIDLEGISVSKNPDSQYYKNIYVQLKDKVDFDGAMRFLDIVNFGLENSKTPLLDIEPSEVTYDINGKPIVKIFLDDLYQYADDFENINKNLEYRLTWKDMFLMLEKKGSEFRVTMMFFAKE